MTNYEQLKQDIAAVVKANGVQAITGDNLQGVLKMMVDALGSEYALAGIAQTTTNPPTPDGRTAYIAETAGTYTHFIDANANALVVPNNCLTALLLYDPSTEAWECKPFGMVAAGTIGTAELADGAVTTPKLASGAVTTPKLATGAVTNPKIGAGAVSEDKLATAVQNKINNAVMLTGDQYIHGTKEFDNAVHAAAFRGLENMETLPIYNIDGDIQLMADEVDVIADKLSVDGDVEATGKIYTNSEEVATKNYVDGVDSGKADKVSGATNGNFAGLDANGNLIDSGKKAADFATAAQGAKADTAYQKPASGIPETDLSADVQTSLGKAETALQDIPDGSVTTPKIADEAVTLAKIAPSTIDAIKGTHIEENGVKKDYYIDVTNGVRITNGTIDDIAYEGKSYRFIFEESNKPLYSGGTSYAGFDDGTWGTKMTTNNGSPIVTNEESYTPNFSLKCFGTSSIGIKSTYSTSSGTFFIAAKVKCTRYVGGNVGIWKYQSSEGVYVNGTTDWKTISRFSTGAGLFYCGTINSANADAYIDSPVWISLSIFSVVPTLEQLTAMYDAYIERKKNAAPYNVELATLSDVSTFVDNEQDFKEFFVSDGYVKGTCTGNLRPVVNIDVASGAKAYYRINVPSSYTRLILYVDEINIVRIFDSQTDTLIQDEWVEFTAPQAMTYIAVYVTGFTGTITLEATRTIAELETIKDDITELKSQVVPKFGRLNVSGEIAPTEFLRTSPVYIDKDSLLSARIEGTIQTIQVGVGKTPSGYTYYGHWLEIDGTNVKLYWYNNNTNVLLNTYAHGLTLTSKTTIVVESKITGNTKTTILRLSDDLGNMFTQTLSAWGVGAAFVMNSNTSGNLSVEVSLFPRQLTKKIWLFGDSYTNFTSSDRWPYYLADIGLLDYFANNQPGLSPANAKTALDTLLSLGFTPSFLVWTLGMNGDTTETQSGGVYIINANQKAVIDAVVNVCEEKGITPVFGTVPTVPTRQKTGFCNYIRSLGYRYIDFAAAVGSDSAGNWNTGLLSSDGVHPTAAGAKVLAARALADFPEFAIME